MATKVIKRTIITGYLYEVFAKEGTTLVLKGELTSGANIRSIKQGREELVKNNFDESCVLVLKDTLSKQFSIDEDVFMQYAKEVTDAKEDDKEVSNQ